MLRSIASSTRIRVTTFVPVQSQKVFLYIYIYMVVDRWLVGQLARLSSVLSCVVSVEGFRFNLRWSLSYTVLELLHMVV